MDGMGIGRCGGVRIGISPSLGDTADMVRCEGVPPILGLPFGGPAGLAAPSSGLPSLGGGHTSTDKQETASVSLDELGWLRGLRADELILLGSGSGDLQMPGFAPSFVRLGLVCARAPTHIGRFQGSTAGAASLALALARTGVTAGSLGCLGMAWLKLKAHWDADKASRPEL